jgi:hypothetical protein
MDSGGRIAILIGLALLSLAFAGRTHPAKGDWYENVQTKERVQVAKVDTGATIISLAKAVNQRMPNIPAVISVHGDSAKMIGGICVDIMIYDTRGGRGVFVDRIYGVDDFKANFLFIKSGK